MAVFAKPMDVDAFLRQIGQAAPVEGLAAYVKRAYTAAQQHRCATGVEEEMLKGVRAYRGMYNPEDMALLSNPYEVYMGITTLKAKALQNWMLDIIAQAEDRPWTIEPTPVPELPQRLEDIVVNRLALEFQRGGFEEDQYRDLAAKAKSIGLRYAQEMASDAAEGMELKINDQLLKGGWRRTFSEFFVDLSVYPAAVVKGPTMGWMEQMRYINGVAVEEREIALHTGRINPFDVFPAPNAACPQSGNYVVHIDRMSQCDLYDLIGLYGFDEIAIRQTISENPKGATSWLPNYNAPIDCLQRTDSEQNDPDHEYHVLVYYGKIPARFLMEYNVDIGDMHQMLECEVRVVGGRVIRAILNPYPLKRRPIHKAEYQPEPGSFWGRSLPSQIHDVQRMTNAAARAIVKNVGYSSGPFVEYDHERLVFEESVNEVTPYRMVAVKPDPFNSGGAAYRFHKIDNVSTRLLEVYNHFRREADDQSGIPAYAIGTPQTSGAGRTLGGLSLLMGNAAKGVKRILANVDRGVIEPVVEMHYHLNLRYSDDETIKADACVLARGASGLLQRELSQARAVEVLQLLTPYASNGLVPPESVIMVLRDVIKSLGYDADMLNIEDPKVLERLEAVAAQVTQQGPIPTPLQGGVPPAARNTGPGTPLPTLDGRSAVPPDPFSLEATGAPI